MTTTAPTTAPTTCTLPAFGAIQAGTRQPCPTCGTPIIWDSPYGPGRWVHALPRCAQAAR